MGLSPDPGVGLMVGAVLSIALQVSAVTHLVIVAGIGGEPQYTQRFHEWATALIEVAEERGTPRSNIHYLAERAELAAGMGDATSTRENLENLIGDIAGSAGPDDRIVVVLFGHGSEQNGVPKFNLPGPDITAAELAVLLGQFPTQTVAVINASSSSGGFIAALSGVNRVVVTATRSGRERTETRFADFFVRAFSGGDADTDKDNRVSLLEAFNYARVEVGRYYEQDNRIQTEHALLDDNGDGEGSHEPDGLQSDGLLARRMFLSSAAADGVLAGPTGDDPELVALYREKELLEERIAALRTRRDSLATEDYELQLEDLIVELALTTRTIRQREEQ